MRRKGSKGSEGKGMGSEGSEGMGWKWEGCGEEVVRKGEKGMGG